MSKSWLPQAARTCGTWRVCTNQFAACCKQSCNLTMQCKQPPDNAAKALQFWRTMSMLCATTGMRRALLRRDAALLLRTPALGATAHQGLKERLLTAE